MTRATWALRALCVVGFAAAVWLWASGRCPWGVAGLAMLAYLAVFLTTLPEPVEWVPTSDPQPPAGFTIGGRVEPGVVSEDFRRRVSHLADCCPRCGGDWFECRSAACRGLRS